MINARVNHGAVVDRVYKYYNSSFGDGCTNNVYHYRNNVKRVNLLVFIHHNEHKPQHVCVATINSQSPWMVDDFYQ
jgi:hypothetical protein